MTASLPSQVSDKTGFSLARFVVWLARAISTLVYFYILLVQIVLLIGFFLLLFGANPTSSFTQWSYRNLASAMEPFRGIFSSIEIGITGNDVPAIFETSILFAMIIYAILAIVLNTFIDWLTGRIHRIDRDIDHEHALEVAEARAFARYQAAAANRAAHARQPDTHLAAPPTPTAQAPVAQPAPQQQAPRQ